MDSTTFIPLSSLSQTKQTLPQESDDPVADAERILRWAGAEFGDRICVTSSFGDGILAHLANSILPGVEITMIDTDYLFAETEWFAEDLSRRFGLNLRVIRPAAGVPNDLWQQDPDACCAARKVAPLRGALNDCDVWASGVRRSDSIERSRSLFVTHDVGFGVIKINPLVAWTDEHVARYALEHGIPEHPLSARGYKSIGCWPCTAPISRSDDPRSGRWEGSAKSECGLHLL